MYLIYIFILFFRCKYKNFWNYYCYICTRSN